MTREEELAELIKEQAKDMAMGSYQPPQPGVLPYGSFMDFYGVKQRSIPTCPVHGVGDLGFDSTTRSGYRCAGCQQENTARRLKTNSEAKLRRAQYDRKRNRVKYATDPEYREKKRAAARRWKEKTREAS